MSVVYSRFPHINLCHSGKRDNPVGLETPVRIRHKASNTSFRSSVTSLIVVRKKRSIAALRYTNICVCYTNIFVSEHHFIMTR